VVVTPVFGAADGGDLVTLVGAWRGALAYTFQLYFDFSGYSDMAIGLARLFGVRLPLNFHSPYKAASITDFWRRWHMTLSGFLRDYLYFPLGGNRKGRRRRHVNLMAVMILGGLWHGAAWTFVLWGALHGAYLLINNAWRAARAGLGLDRLGGRSWSRWTARLVTFLAVVAGWVVFRSEGLDGAWAILSAMVGFGRPSAIGAAPSVFELGVLVTLLGIVFLAPNTHEIMRDAEPAWNMDHLTEPRQTELLVWKPSMAWGLVVAAAFLAAFVNVTKVREFLYFQF
jgi:D-alanyl-lipoteichoic acid acyltransferase DltB (MBOAT superfamily)